MIVPHTESGKASANPLATGRGRSKKVVIDARVVVGNHGHGILRYTEELLIHLQNIQSELEFVLLVNRDSPFVKRSWPKNFSLFVMRTRWISFLGQFELAWVLRAIAPDLFHTPSFMVPLFANYPLITTIHDLNHVVLSENYSIFHRIYYSLILAKKVYKARAVITVSHFSRSEILSYFRLDPAKVRVIYNGIADHFREFASFDETKVQKFLEKYELPDQYILSIGNRKPHKNVLRTVQAYCSGQFDLPLVLLTEYDPEILEVAERAQKKHRIYFLRFVTTQDFPMVYARARAFVYPSLYEGFGFPPLEAAACGVPTVVSKRASLPEVLQDGAVYVDPEDVLDIRRGIEQALDDSETMLQCVARGKQIAQQYRWSLVAQQTLDVYLSVLGSQAGEASS